MEKKPEWLKVRYNQEAVTEVAELMRDLNLNTVCKEANCPNLGECYRKHPGRPARRRRRAVCQVRPGHPGAVPRNHGGDPDLRHEDEH